MTILLKSCAKKGLSFTLPPPCNCLIISAKSWSRSNTCCSAPLSIGATCDSTVKLGTHSGCLLRLYWFPDHLIYLEIGLTSSHTICAYLGKLFEFAFAVISGGSLGCSSRAHTAQVPELLPLFLLYPVPFFLALNQCFTNNQTLALTLDLCSLEAKS